jgi:hypothetical protein
MSGFALASKRLQKIKNNYNDEKFFRDLFVLAGIIFSGGVGLGAGAGSVAARGFIAKMAQAGYVKLGATSTVTIKTVLATLFLKISEELYDWATTGDLGADAALKELIYETTGLELDGFTKEDTKKAIGKYLANFLNEQIPDLDLPPLYPLENTVEIIGQAIANVINARAGTSFTSVYPPENFISEIKLAAIADITSGAHKLFSAQDIVSLKAGLNAIKDDDLVEQFGVYAGTALNIPPTQQVSLKVARRRAQGRARSREYYRTHKRNNTWQPR